MEGIYFYWLAWIGWIWATFFMDKKNPVRIKLAAGLMAVMIAASFEMNVFIFEINLSAFAIAFFLVYETKKKNLGASLYLFFSSFIIMLGYTSFLLFELFDPVWVLFDRKILLSACVFYLALLLHKNKFQRGLSLTAGCLQGEILYAAILSKFNFPYTISSLAFLDILIISIAMLLAWSAIETVIALMSRSTITHAEGEEHRTS